VIVPSLRRERRLWNTGLTRVAGVDEVGVAPTSGAVVAAAVVMKAGCKRIPGVRDSKTLSAGQRERLYPIIRRRALAVGVGAASVAEIDRLNIYHATALAMRRSLARLRIAPDHVVVDGNPVRSLGCAHSAVVGGDARCYTVACASIVAKVTRDRVMRALGLRHPAYEWTRNVGYATDDHVAGLASHGVSAHHRRTFWRVAAALAGLPVIVPPSMEIDPSSSDVELVTQITT
jgi:ribonuclease HII